MEMTSDQTHIWKNQDRIPYHIRQFEEPYRSSVHLGRFIQSLVPTPTGDALDVACGAGANIFYLSQLFPHYRWAGVDIAGDVLFSIGRQQFRDRGRAVTLIEGDLYKLTDVFPDRRFDLVLSIQTLLGLPEYEEAMDQLLAVTRGWLFVTSLFTDFDVDAKIQAMDYARPDDCQGPFYYNVYSLARFRAFCESRGCRQFASQDFDIDIDLPRPQKYGLTTYTQTLIDGRRLQFTGPLLQPWKFVGIRMGDQ
jgi:SAM-dependent methyltransferase